MVVIMSWGKQITLHAKIPLATYTHTTTHTHIHTGHTYKGTHPHIHRKFKFSIMTVSCTSAVREGNISK